MPHRGGRLHLRAHGTDVPLGYGRALRPHGFVDHRFRSAAGKCHDREIVVIACFDVLLEENMASVS